MFWFLGWEACGILAPWSGTKHAPSALKGEVLTTAPPGKSWAYNFESGPFFSFIYKLLPSFHLKWGICFSVQRLYQKDYGAIDGSPG